MSVTLDCNEVAFLAARMRRLCKAFGQPIDDSDTDEFVVGVAGSLIGGLLLNIQMKEPVCWIRYCSDGGIEGPIMHSQIERVRVESGAWTPLIAKPTESPKNGGGNAVPTATPD